MRNLQKKLAVACTLISVICLSSCSSSKFVPLMPKESPPILITWNHYCYSVQNMDDNGKTDNKNLMASYDGFNVLFRLNEKCQMYFVIENKSNKSLILDKSKCYVLYDGYSSDLFKDVRSGKITTYNNVQDAITNVQTNESSVTMSIPPYSKWAIPVEETNIKVSSLPEELIGDIGDYQMTPYTTNATIEFIIPYSYDYTLAKWGTIRNRLYISDIHVEKQGPMYISKEYKEVRVKNNTIQRGGVVASDLKEYYDVIKYNMEVEYRNATRR